MSNLFKEEGDIIASAIILIMLTMLCLKAPIVGAVVVLAVGYLVLRYGKITKDKDETI